jgi:hypothetical protein
MTPAIRTASRLAAIAIVASAALAACSSGGDAASPSGSGSALASGASAQPGTSSSGTVVGSASPTSAAGLACSAYFALDLLNSKYASGGVDDGNMTEVQVKADFTRLLTDMVKQGRLAAADGTADDKVVKNAVRMRKEVNALKKKATLAQMPASAQTKFAEQSLRVQRSCDRAGYPLPADNVAARTTAGLASGG